MLKPYFFAKFVPVVTTLCMLGMKFEIFSARSYERFLGFSYAKNVPFAIFFGTLDCNKLNMTILEMCIILPTLRSFFLLSLLLKVSYLPFTLFCL